MILGDLCERVVSPPEGLRPTGWETLVWLLWQEDLEFKASLHYSRTISNKEILYPAMQRP